MCGIAAVINSANALNTVQQMLSELDHRGDSADNPKALAKGFSALGTQRLRINDFPGGTQPFTSFDGKWKLVFNGEIYNHAKLRDEMRAKGIPFQSRCDTEVLVNLLSLEGVDAIKRLDGMFAFVALHRDGRQWIASRDPMGIKPLYFVQKGASLFFASEIAPLLHATSGGAVQIFPPGTWRTAKAAGSHWEMPVAPPFSRASHEGSARTLKKLFERAVAKRLPPDLPCAVLFSGGIDSTLLLHVARKLDPSVRGFYIGDKRGKDFEYAKLYADEFKLPVEFVSFTRADVLKRLPKVVQTIETFEPNQIRSGAFSYLVSEAIAKKGYRVALCGEGADELFCGYPELYEAPRGICPSQREGIILERRRHFLNYLHRTQLQRVDRCGMRFALEVRVPFLDRSILEFAARLPLNQMVDPNKPSGTGNKSILRGLYSLYPEIPEIFSTRKKVVFVEGSGMGNNSKRSPFFRHASASRAECPEPCLQKFSGPLNVEERLYLSWLSETHDVSRIPHLLDRPQLNQR